MEGKNRVAKGGGKKLGWVIPVVIVAVLAAAYLGLCALANRDALWPNTTLGGVDVSDLSPAEAASLVETVLPRQWEEQSLTVTEPDSGKQYQLPMAGAAQSKDLGKDVLAAAKGGAADAGFLTLGGRFLMSFFGGNELPLELELTADGEKAVTQLLDTMNQELGEVGGEATWTVADNVLTVKKGVTVVRADREALENGFMAALSGGPLEVEVSLSRQAPEVPDWQTVYDEVAVEPVDAQLDRESWEIVPSVTGISFDVDQLAEQFDAAAEGQEITVALTLTEPEITTEVLDQTLFRDTLGSASTKFTGSASRRQNIARACALMNGMVLFPGDEFSYSKTCSPYSVANGYGYAGAYVDGKTVDSLAGGICQGSSTLYWAVLKSNLNVVERYPHIYEPSYISGGLDATVYGSYGTPGYLDFRFSNNTKAPIRITAYMSNDNFVCISIQGTNTTGVTAQPYSANRTVTQYATTIYEPNAGIAPGTTSRDYTRTAYNAVSIEAYLQLTDASGKVISTEFLHRDNYRLRNAVVWYNPADAALWGIDPATGLQTLTPQTPAPSGAPTESPLPSGVPGESPLPLPSGSPEVPPVVTDDPDAPVLPPMESVPPVPAETPAVVPSQAPVTPTEAPVAPTEPTPAPAASQAPAVPPAESAPAA